MKPSISVCITTYHRPKFLKEALHSVLEQSLQPIEIVIGDDSRDDVTEKMILDMQKSCPIPISYTRHSPSLGQARNVNFIYAKAQGHKIVLLHDDDLLLPKALEDLHSCWDTHPDLVAAYGKQYIMSEEGEIDLEQSHNLNQMFFRTSDRAGLQKSSVEAAILHQFPNDCFMILASAAKDIKWRSYEEVGNGGEFDFSLQLGLKYKNFFFLDTYTAKYRLSRAAMSKSDNDDAAAQSFNIVLNTDVPEELAWAKEFELKRAAPIAILQSINLGKKKQAFDIYFSKYHPLSKRLSLGGMRRLLKLLLPRSLGKLL
ncbi:glycosyltransferase family 2 protein [Pseudanabaena sp. UWO310]|uniref:glycosyltransferase family 2 protein n=1 Tax=Pseudanabaena sp. UWO310 TaxID=2480795 RepID=UPI00115B5272|nr:glycosyltransferase [Pseudanabaena sp. UWO310]TYQ31078.1 glycosyltransferase [Pseudanabaena sp. UWO310]